ncbi:MAG: DUF1003 domain-containing protein [Bacilli bacterium]|nr:DUF1003 domain-containing protein [Bacilli bacterium]
MQNKKLDLVKMLLKQDLKSTDEKDLFNLLVENSISIDVDKEAEQNAKFGDKVADKFTKLAGSWGFIIGFVIFLASWVVLNTILLTKHFDEYPFILLNLLLSCISALQAPIIMMSQNRQAKRESMRNDNDYRIDLKSELILEEVYSKLKIIINNQDKILKYIKNDKKKSKGK